jgi:hypothetical protein
VSSLFSVDVNPKAMIGGGVARGLATLSLPAPAGGMVVTLSSGDPLVTVPSSVTVPAGAETVEFPVTGQATAVDRQVVITAAAERGSASTTLSLWVPAPGAPSFWFISEPGDAVARGDARRFGADSAFSASCSASRVTIDVRQGTERWTAQFSAPLGGSLRVGTYENAVSPSPRPQSSPFDRPELGVSGNGSTCSTSGQFVVHEVDLTQNGMVRSFWASFRQQCQGRPQVLNGGVRITNVPGSGGELACYDGNPLPLPTPSQATFLRFASTLGDYIGAGQTRLFEAPVMTFGGDMRLDNNLLLLSIVGTEGSRWTLFMGAPAGRRLTTGVYRNAKRAPDRGSGDPSLSLSGEGRDCNTSIGEFEVLEAVYGRKPDVGDASGTIERFRARFTQYCDGRPGGLSGDLSLVSVPLRCTVVGLGC